MYLDYHPIIHVRAEHVSSLHGPTAPLVTELLQLLALETTEQFTIISQRCGLIVQSVLSVTKDFG